jgi:hydroxymethylglutaryl-CoA lyase
VEFGAHLHSRPESALVKVEAAYHAGCRRFDSALRGFGGCPMADDELVGNLATEKLATYFQQKNVETGLNEDALKKALEKSTEIFSGIL